MVSVSFAMCHLVQLRLRLHTRLIVLPKLANFTRHFTRALCGRFSRLDREVFWRAAGKRHKTERDNTRSSYTASRVDNDHDGTKSDLNIGIIFMLRPARAASARPARCSAHEFPQSHSAVGLVDWRLRCIESASFCMCLCAQRMR